MPQIVATEKIVYTIYEDGILGVRYRDGQSVNSKAEARQLKNERQKIQGVESCKLLMDATVKVHMSGGAKRYLSNPEGIQGIAAIALLVGDENITVLKQLMVYLWKRRLHIPIGIYHTEEAAMEWLRSLPDVHLSTRE